MVLEHKWTHRSTEHNPTGSPEINPHLNGQSMIKEATIYDGVKTISSVNGVGKTGQPHIK